MKVYLYSSISIGNTVCGRFAFAFFSGEWTSMLNWFCGL